jgi:MoaA/NifB/PqqE/SkfB family radical SAM enzyme
MGGWSALRLPNKNPAAEEPIGPRVVGLTTGGKVAGGYTLVNAGFQPQTDPEWGAVGQFLTFVVPASNGCNLKCPFCLVRHRREITETKPGPENLAPENLAPEDLARFVREAAQSAPIFAVAVQGYEPLLSESIPYTQAILATGRFLSLPTTLVTNGVRLADAVGWLKTLSPAKIAVSLDAAAADIHDHVRGVAGAWAMTVHGIRRAIDVLAPQTRLAVASVLIPNRRHYLEGMPARLRDIGIDRWIISPLVRVGRDAAGGPVGDRAALFRDLLILQDAAVRTGVRMTVDDEFGHLHHDAAYAAQPSLRALHVRTLPPRVDLFRLAPGGQCSRGGDVLRQVTSETPRWRPGVMHAGDFLEMLSGTAAATDVPSVA